MDIIIGLGIGFWVGYGIRALKVWNDKKHQQALNRWVRPQPPEGG
jgi:hypothetical protein